MTIAPSLNFRLRMRFHMSRLLNVSSSITFDLFKGGTDSQFVKGDTDTGPRRFRLLSSPEKVLMCESQLFFMTRSLLQPIDN